MNLLGLIFSPIVWIPIVTILGVATYQNYKKRNRLQVLNLDSVLLMLEIPKDNDKKELSAEQLFASLHGILRDAEDLRNSGGVQEHLSFEIASVGNQIRFFVWTPKILQSFVEGQIYAQYPSVQIYRIKEDYVDRRKNYPINLSTEIVLTENEALPIKTFDTFEVDPLAGITGPLAKLNPNGEEELWIQILTCPIADDWHKKSERWIDSVKTAPLAASASTGNISRKSSPRSGDHQRVVKQRAKNSPTATKLASPKLKKKPPNSVIKSRSALPMSARTKLTPNSICKP